MGLIKKVLNFINTRVFVNETVILFTHRTNTNQTSRANVGQANLDNLNDILNFQDSKYINIFKDFLKKGDKGYFGYIDNKCVHRSWVKFGPQKVYLHYPLLQLKLEKGEVFIHYCETASTARGKNIYSHVLSIIAEDYIKKNKIFISTTTNNIASIKGIKKAGFKEYKIIKITCVIGIKFIKEISKLE